MNILFLNRTHFSSHSQICLLLCTLVISLFLSACHGGSTSEESNSGDSLRSDTVNNFHLISSTRYDQAGLYVSSNDYHYDLEENRITTTSSYLDSDGNTISLEPDYSFYNSDGYLIRTEFSDQKVRTNTYHANGLLKERMESIFLNNSIIPATNVAKFEYDESGNLMSIISTDEYGIYATHTYDYDTEGNLVSESHKQIFNGFGQLAVETPENTRITTTVFTTNDLGQLVDAKRTDPESGMIYSSSYRYDSNGNVIERSTDNAGEFHRTTYLYETNVEPIVNFLLFKLKYYP